ncbi:hypothetical protein CEXT_307681, partial [Caerostris extrusa]
LLASAAGGGGGSTEAAIRSWCPPDTLLHPPTTNINPQQLSIIVTYYVRADDRKDSVLIFTSGLPLAAGDCNHPNPIYYDCTGRGILCWLCASGAGAPGSPAPWVDKNTGGSPQLPRVVLAAREMPIPVPECTKSR